MGLDLDLGQHGLPVVPDDQPIDYATHGEICFMCHRGDTKITWKRDNPVEVEKARETFDKYLKDGWTCFRGRTKDDPGWQVRTFPADAGHLVFVPPMAGG